MRRRSLGFGVPGSRLRPISSNRFVEILIDYSRRPAAWSNERMCLRKKVFWTATGAELRARVLGLRAYPLPELSPVASHKRGETLARRAGRPLRFPRPGIAFGQMADDHVCAESRVSMMFLDIELGVGNLDANESAMLFFHGGCRAILVPLV